MTGNFRPLKFLNKFDVSLETHAYTIPKFILMFMKSKTHFYVHAYAVCQVF